MKGKNRELFAISLLAFFFFLSFLYWSKKEIYIPKNPRSGQEIIFLIKKGQSAKEISDNLKKEGLIKYSFLFRIYVMARGISDKLQAGTYSLSPKMTIPEIAEKFATGDIIKKQILILEGWSLKDIGFNLESQKIVKAEDFFEVVGYPQKEYSGANLAWLIKDFDFLKDKPKNLNLEGYLFPDTYEVFPEEDVKDIVKKILANFDKKLEPNLRQEIRSQKKSVFEIITMASLLEKEVKTFEDKKIVAGILWKRLEINMPLQVDATISYITGKNTRKISIRDTKIDSPYNTYKYKGLPQGPISNPGMESILAAIYPQKSQYLYYLSTKEGQTIFSKTFEEHKAAKKRFN